MSEKLPCRLLAADIDGLFVMLPPNSGVQLTSNREMASRRAQADSLLSFGETRAAKRAAHCVGGARLLAADA
jgi:hypothetical protein